MSDIEVFSDCRDLLGECPRWHPGENRLYWVDIDTGAVHSKTARETAPITHQVDLKVGSLAFESSGSLILATSRGIQRWDAARSHLTLLSDPEAGKPGARFNDGRVDGAGRFWAGTMTECDATSALYCLDADLQIRTMETGITISNGLGWNKENTRFYFTDTLERVVWQYDFDLPTGLLANRRVFLEGFQDGLPDGLAVDSNGNLWIVICGGGRIEVHDPSGKLLDLLRFPTRCITACTFGGPELTDLYVTSSRSLLTSPEQAQDPLAGNVFKFSTRFHGQPDYFFR